MDLYLLNELNKLESGSGGGSAVGAFMPAKADGTALAGKDSWAAVLKHSNRHQQDNVSFSSSSSYTTWYGYISSQNDAEFAFSHAIHNPHMYAGETTRSNFYNGSDKELAYWDGTKLQNGGISHGKTGASYGGFTSMVMFVKNPTAADITQTVYTTSSGGWSAGYEGSGFGYFTPNNTDKSLVTSAPWTSRWTYTTNSTASNNSHSVTFPAGKTIAMLLNTSDYHWTGTTYNYYFVRNAGFYNLQTLVAAGLVCDHQMTQTAMMGRVSGANYNGAWRLWNECAKYFPEAA